MTTNLFVIANAKQLRTGGSFRILLPFFRISWCTGVLNSVFFNSFHSRVEFGTILEGLRNFGRGGVEPPQTLPLGTPLLEVTRLDNQINDKGKLKYNPIFKIIIHGLIQRVLTAVTPCIHPLPAQSQSTSTAARTEQQSYAVTILRKL